MYEYDLHKHKARDRRRDVVDQKRSRDVFDISSLIRIIPYYATIERERENKDEITCKYFIVVFYRLPLPLLRIATSRLINEHKKHKRYYFR